VATAVADLSTREGVERGVGEVLTGFAGQVDVLVNNVGVGAVRTFEELSDDDWHRTFDVNFLSYVRTIRATLPVLRAVLALHRQQRVRPGAPTGAEPPRLRGIEGRGAEPDQGPRSIGGPGMRVNAVAPGRSGRLLDQAGRLR